MPDLLKVHTGWYIDFHNGNSVRKYGSSRALGRKSSHTCIRKAYNEYGEKFFNILESMPKVREDKVKSHRNVGKNLKKSRAFLSLHEKYTKQRPRVKNEVESTSTVIAQDLRTRNDASLLVQQLNASLKTKKLIAEKNSKPFDIHGKTQHVIDVAHSAHVAQHETHGIHKVHEAHFAQHRTHVAHEANGIHKIKEKHVSNSTLAHETHGAQGALIGHGNHGTQRVHGANGAHGAHVTHNITHAAHGTRDAHTAHFAQHGAHVAQGAHFDAELTATQTYAAQKPNIFFKDSPMQQIPEKKINQNFVTQNVQFNDSKNSNVQNRTIHTNEKYINNNASNQNSNSQMYFTPPESLNSHEVSWQAQTNNPWQNLGPDPRYSEQANANLERINNYIEMNLMPLNFLTRPIYMQQNAQQMPANSISGQFEMMQQQKQKQKQKQQQQLINKHLCLNANMKRHVNQKNCAANTKSTFIPESVFTTYATQMSKNTDVRTPDSFMKNTKINAPAESYQSLAPGTYSKKPTLQTNSNAKDAIFAVTLTRKLAHLKTQNDSEFGSAESQ